MALLLFLGIALRVYSINGPGVVPDRQYRSFLIARAYYFASLPTIPGWRQDVAGTSSQRQEALEPQITERIVALLYRIVGGERFWIARLVTSFFWLMGALPLYALARRMGSVDNAVIATAYYVLVPFGVLMSLSFLPESLMIMMVLFSLLTILRYYDQPSHFRLILAASVSGLTLFIKPLVVFMILGAFIALALHKKGTLKRLLDRPFLLFVTLSLLPGALFYGYGIIGAGYLRWKVEASFLPHFFLSKTYWEGWFLAGVEAVGFTPLIVALLGIPTLRKGWPSALLIGLGAGYVVFCLLFNYFVHFASYYHAQLIVIVALSIGPVLALVTRHLRPVWARWYGWAPVLFALLCIALYTVRQINQSHVYPSFEGEQIASEIGDLVHHSNRVAYLAHVYGLPLEYYGELAGEYWPRRTKGWPLQRANERPLSIEARCTTLGFVPEYFVITQFEEYHRHHDDLKDVLEQQGRLVAHREQYLIYSLPGDFCRP